MRWRVRQRWRVAQCRRTIEKDSLSLMQTWRQQRRRYVEAEAEAAVYLPVRPVVVVRLVWFLK